MFSWTELGAKHVGIVQSLLVVGAGANVLVFGRFEIAVISDSRPYFAPGLDCQMSSKSLKWRLLKRRRQSETREAKKKERRIGSMISPAEFIHFRLGADTGDLPAARYRPLRLLRRCAAAGRPASGIESRAIDAAMLERIVRRQASSFRPIRSRCTAQSRRWLTGYIVPNALADLRYLSNSLQVAGQVASTDVPAWQLVMKHVGWPSGESALALAGGRPNS